MLRCMIAAGWARVGLPLDPALVVEGLFSFDSGAAAARRPFALRPRPTAVFAGNDDSAAGVMWAAAHGLSVPGDVSLPFKLRLRQSTGPSPVRGRRG